MNNESDTLQQASLYERLGGEQRIRKIVNELLDRDLKNFGIENGVGKAEINEAAGILNSLKGAVPGKWHGPDHLIFPLY